MDNGKYDVLDTIDSCPNCDNVGWYIVQDSFTGEPLQEQCEWCYTNPMSRFNFDNNCSS